ncbi:hypothetical protein B0T11DRAFT_301410 [Plectosphaerella cucumerina]|uniref:Uncharacterized protein n=1 Tax=Plectosphaerella cucumerina TaxID=40658 RepID=A0A8K0T751_9PEZI|nr:hypothetical protein B0T11DRAFT_301410 [Plectosphaerella cucumerina]
MSLALGIMPNDADESARIPMPVLGTDDRGVGLRKWPPYGREHQRAAAGPVEVRRSLPTTQTLDMFCTIPRLDFYAFNYRLRPSLEGMVAALAVCLKKMLEMSLRCLGWERLTVPDNSDSGKGDDDDGDSTTRGVRLKAYPFITSSLFLKVAIHPSPLKKFRRGLHTFISSTSDFRVKVLGRIESQWKPKIKTFSRLRATMLPGIGRSRCTWCLWLTSPPKPGNDGYAILDSGQDKASALAPHEIINFIVANAATTTKDLVGYYEAERHDWGSEMSYSDILAWLPSFTSQAQPTPATSNFFTSPGP